MTSNRSARCWGEGSDGQIGNGVRRSQDETAATVVAPGSNIYVTPEVPAKTCVAEGLKAPIVLKAVMRRERIKAHPGNVEGVGSVTYRVASLPYGCRGFFERSLEAKVQFATTTLRFGSWFDGGYGPWWPVWSGNEASVGTQSDSTRWFKHGTFGRITRFEVVARLRVRDLQTNKVIGQRLIPVPTRIRN